MMIESIESTRVMPTVNSSWWARTVSDVCYQWQRAGPRTGRMTMSPWRICCPSGSRFAIAEMARSAIEDAVSNPGTWVGWDQTLQLHNKEGKLGTNQSQRAPRRGTSSMAGRQT